MVVCGGAGMVVEVWFFVFESRRSSNSLFVLNLCELNTAAHHLIG
jgi:hypothetical protein